VTTTTLWWQLADHVPEGPGPWCGRCGQPSDGHERALEAERAWAVEAGWVVVDSQGRVGPPPLVASGRQRFHAGPGPHPGTGSPQQAHAGGRGGGGGVWSPSFAPNVTNAGARKATAAGMERVGARYPGLVKGVEVRVAPESYSNNNPTVVAATPTDGGDRFVDLSSRYVDDPAEAARRIDLGERNGGLVRTPSSVTGFERAVVHEMAHVAEHRFPGLRGDIDVAFRAEFGMSMAEFIADANQTKDDPSQFAQDAFFKWSQYGTESVHEFIAEAFTDGMLNSSPSRFGEVVVGVFDAHVGSAMGAVSTPPLGGQQ
jgi:hypothetical protein